jgi:tetratricopeptide (TPR) repeat protein
VDHEDLKVLGEALRRIRQEKGLRLRDLQDENISIATLSCIERGVATVKQRNRDYYLKLLGLDPGDVPRLIGKEQESQKDLVKDLLLMEKKINLSCPHKALAKLKQLHREQSGPILGVIRYLIGLAHLKKGSWKMAEKYFNLALKLYDPRSNIKAGSLKELGRIAFKRDNDLRRALDYVEEGLASFVEDGERQELKYYLEINKVSYMEKLYMVDDALRALENLWQSINKITNIEIILNMYEIRARLLNWKGKHDQALQYGEKGLAIAADNEAHERAVELATVCGDILADDGQLDDGKRYYMMALEMDNLITKKYLLITTHTHLGKLYTITGQWEKAYSELQLATEIGRKYNDAHRYCLALKALGDYYLAREAHEESIEPYTKAMTIAEKHGYNNIRERILVYLSECYKVTGNTEKYIELMGTLQVQLRLIHGGGVRYVQSL